MKSGGVHRLQATDAEGQQPLSHPPVSAAGDGDPSLPRIGRMGESQGQVWVNADGE